MYNLTLLKLPRGHYINKSQPLVTQIELRISIIRQFMRPTVHNLEFEKCVSERKKSLYSIFEHKHVPLSWKCFNAFETQEISTALLSKRFCLFLTYVI